MGSQSLLYYAALTWLSPLYLDAGWSASRAGLLLGLFSLTQVFSALAIPALADRTGDHRPWVALCVGVATAMLAAIGLAPTAAPWPPTSDPYTVRPRSRPPARMRAERSPAPPRTLP